MEILVYLDDEDKKAIERLVRGCKGATEAESTKVKNAFWYGMIDKYPVLKNRRLALNALDHYIFSPAGHQDMKYSTLGNYDV